ncbi:hypothetical protein ASPWEDRAFT_115266 [Aspergillus wentii DTO 134E9]|uniref:MATH and UCH domain protein n=1 Tax=Aspergillus wentii DTO 134E9 TaxID=1073089 RepID=A0A1L9RCW6_ASPWE|nr:uncharacterized protein ASPWEDRAFT_115266 [Aspergillus wentii DTO 134E9]KAI9924316.1 hypothetical protein MW887_007266 [Aspergillus wentii]OJJ32738.1 hypothetical protein ASPWEDRAFT_115266 [Aspergillus wentii DTO 134E9]
MDTRVDTSVTVEQLPPPITLSVDAPLPPPADRESTVTINTPEESNETPENTDQTNDTTVPSTDEPVPSEPQEHNNASNEPPPQDSPNEGETPSTESESAPPAPSELEEAYWAEIEEDKSVPDEAELKDIESAADGDYSAYEYKYWEKNFHPELDDPEYRPSEKARLTWKIKGVRGNKENPNRSKIMRSPPAYIGGYWWTIKFFPRGNNVSSLSVYIECSTTMPTCEKTLPDTEFKVLKGAPDGALDDSAPDLDMKFGATEDTATWLENFKSQYPPAANTEATTNDSWRVSAQIGVILYNPDEPRTGWMQSSCHQFNPHNLDWGWTNFHGPWDQIHRRQRGQRQALLRNDTLAFDAYIRIFDDPTRSLWWHASDSEPTWDSLGLTGYRPLGDSVINHSAEVAGLATWLHIAPFCKIIQGVDVLEHLSNPDVKPKPVCDALQRFLWQLRCRGKSLQYVDTDVITSTLRNLHEYSSDVSEFWERLRRTLELELAGTGAAKEFAKLFDSPSLPLDAMQLSDINTLPSDFNSRICVPADQAKTMREALDWYLGAKPGRWALPPVLNVELNRQKLDKVARQWRLIYDRVELDEELDLTQWTVNEQCGNYVLYGYVVHRGRRTSGKFFSILRPGGPGSRWLAFDDGSDNRVECLTHKTALGPHVGLDASQAPDHKTGHDVAVVAMYIRKDVVGEFLPGPQGQWDAPEPLKEYYSNGTYPVPKTDQDIQVEVYSLPQYDQLGSLFDTYDLMSQAKSANSVMYLDVPRSSNIVELRKKIALWKSTDSEKPSPENVRLWQVGHTRDQFGPTLAFSRVCDLNSKLDLPLKVARFWMQIVSDEDAKYFAMSDPRETNISQNKPEEAIVEREGSESSDERQSVPEADSNQPSSSGNLPNAEPENHEESTPAADDQPMSNGTDESNPANATEPTDSSSLSDNANVESSENDAVIAAIIANDIQELDTEMTGQAAPEPEPEPEPAESTTQNEEESSTPEPESAVQEEPAEPENPLPVNHVYYFIQVFDVENQALRTVGSFFSRKEETIKPALRQHLKWSVDKDFLIWQRIDGTTVTTMSPGETFEMFVPDGACFIVGDRLTKERRAALNEAGLIANPDRLVQYLSAESRKHPTQAFTGFKTIEATFAGDYYSGEFKKGYFHGKGKHVSDTAAIYEGDFVFGRRHGKGLMDYPSGDTYDGDWFEDQRHGQGTFLERKTGNKYVGGYKDGKRHGKGISYWEVADEEMDLCQICYGEEQDALFYDCGHVCACVTCARQVDICPICRKSIISVVKIYRT